MRSWEKCGLAACLAVAFTASEAAMISIAPSAGTTGIGGVLSYDISADFGTDVTLGGGIDIVFNAPSSTTTPSASGVVITFNSFSYASPPPGDPDFLVDPTDPVPSGDVQEPNGLVSIGFGDLTGLSGTFDIGTITFLGVNLGTTAITMQDSLKWGDFDPLIVDYGSATSTVVPLPAAAWLLLSGIGVLGFVGKRKKRH